MNDCYFKVPFTNYCNLFERECKSVCKWFKTPEQFNADFLKSQLLIKQRNLKVIKYKHSDGQVHIKAVKI